MKFFSFSSLCDKQKQKFYIYLNNQYHDLKIIQNSINLLKANVILVSGEDINNFNNEIDEMFPRINQAWAKHKVKIKNKISFLEFEILLTSMAEILLFPNHYLGLNSQITTNHWLLKKRNCGVTNTYYLLLNGNEIHGIPLHYISYICSLEMISNNFVLLHSASIIRNSSLYVFLGKSGSGKSTLYNLSNCHKGFGLDEDKLLIKIFDNELFVSTGWHYNHISSLCPIKGLFFLQKSKNDELCHLTKYSSAKRLINSYEETKFGLDFPNNIEKQVFILLAQLANKVPSYTLKFTKSTDFWDLIDAEFGD